MHPPNEPQPTRETRDATRKVLVITPAYNEAEVIAATIAEVLAAVPLADVLVVDDGSRDDTVTIARDAGAIVLEMPFNMGVGAAMRAGFLFAKRNGYTAAVQVDADGQHNPTNIPLLLAALDDSDIVIGSRFKQDTGYVVHGPRKWAMHMLAFFVSRLAGKRLTDITSGFRAANRRAILQYIQHYPNEYLGDTVDSLVAALKSGYTVSEVPVRMRPRQGGTPSQTPVQAALYLIRSLIVLGVAFSGHRWNPPADVADDDTPTETAHEGRMGDARRTGRLSFRLHKRASPKPASTQPTANRNTLDRNATSGEEAGNA